MRTVLLSLHILAAGAWIGANVTQAVVTPVLSRGSAEVAAAWWRSTVRMGRVLYTPAAVISLVTGIWLVVDSPVYEFEQTFVAIGFAVIVAGAVLGALVFGPGGRRAADLHERGDSAAVGPLERRLTAFGVLDSALLVLVVAAMVGKWGL